jgi:LuxR family maltose regulon positive regulatory protein
MSGDLLQTKLHAPRLRPNLVPRHHLIEVLNQGLATGGKLSLISAPAGFGKTTLVSEWIAGSRRPVAWLSLDEADSDFTRFLTYFIAALQTLELSKNSVSAAEEPAPPLGKRVLGMLASPQPAPTESILTTLINEIATIRGEFALVLDDYHVVNAPPIDQALTFLLEHLPPQLHLIITTREDPLLPLPRLRVRGLLTELRAADMRFTVEETAVFLNQLMGLDLSVEEVAALESRTEGWIAGLQLAALSMRGRDDVHGFIRAFTGDDRYIVDYLVEEVLQGQPEHIRQFLLQTSILDRLNGPLCDAVRFGAAEIPQGEKEGSSLLESLERSNLFVVPLDDKRRWYRYHHLFADVLQAHLMKEQPEEIGLLHQRAGRWYEENELTADAVHHALAAQDFERVARIIELAWARMDADRQSATWLGWLKKVPDELVRTRPVLNIGYAWSLLDAGELEAAELRLQVAEQGLRTQSDQVVSDDLVVVDQAEFHVLPGTIAAARTYLALALDDMPGALEHAQQALDLLPEDDHQRRGTPAALLGLGFWAGGDLTSALDYFTRAMTSYERAGNFLYVITGAYVLADMKLAQGHLREAIRLCEESLQLAEAHGDPVLRGSADLYTGLSELALEQNDLAAAKAHLRQSKELGQEAMLPRWHYRWRVAQAKINVAEGNLDEALDSLDDAELQYVRGPVPDVRATAAIKARVKTAQGRLAEAQRWADEQGLSVDDELSYLREFDHMTLARLRIAQYRRDGTEHHANEALALLERLLQAAEADGRMGSVLAILIQQAMAHEAQGDIPAALEPLVRAVALAEPEGYVRIFVDEGQPMAALLEKMKAENRGHQAYIAQLLAAFGTDTVGDPPPVACPQPLVEPLSERELEVLQLVAEGLPNRQIAERLFLALSTVKGHNRVIYGKLNVSRRTEAVARARELGIL